MSSKLLHKQVRLKIISVECNSYQCNFGQSIVKNPKGLHSITCRGPGSAEGTRRDLQRLVSSKAKSGSNPPRLVKQS
jgi:hypothetical protein